MAARSMRLAAWTVGLTFVATGAADDPKPVAQELKSEEAAEKVRTLGILLYDKFELLDVFGPAEVFGNVGKNLKVVMIAGEAGPVASTQGPKVLADYGLNDCPKLDLILVPGGVGTLRQLSNKPLLEWLTKQSESAELVMSVCSGSAILAKAGILDGKKATCNKQYFKMLTGGHKGVEWVVEARWVEDGKFVTSSGVSAGMDMALAVVERLYGGETAEAIANGTEYDWHRDSTWDPFAKFVK